MKNILKISTIVLGIIAVGLLYYYFFFFKASTPTINTSTKPSSTNFFPFGQGGTTGNTTKPNTNTNPTTQQLQQASNYLQKLRLISNEPVAGATFIENKNTVIIRYIEKATGHIYDVSTNSATINQISNTTLPKIHEAFFTDLGLGLIARSVGDDGESIQTIYSKLPASVATTTQKIASSSILTLNPLVLQTNIPFLTVSPSTKNIFYTQKSFAGSTGIIALSNGTSKKQIWSSPVRSVYPQFSGENTVLVTTAPNASVYGYAYLVNTKTGGVKNILGNIYDLSVFANTTGTDFVYYTSASGGQFFHYVLANSSTTPLTPTTFPEKCVFDTSSKTSLYCAVPNDSLSQNSLDNWYLGLNSYSDSIWKYDLKAGTSQMIEDLSSNAGRNIDVINMHINTVGSLLLFQSKTDGSLWSLNVGA